MIEQATFVRVEELAGRVGYPMPSVRQVECKEGESCILLRLNEAGGATLMLHQGLEERYPDRVRDFLIAQEFVQARQGVHQQLRWIRASRAFFGMAVGGSAALLGARLLEPLWLAFLVAMAVGYVLMTGVNLLVSAIWSRLAIGRADRVLVEVLGKAQVVEALEWYAAVPGPPILRYLRNGAPATASERLRRLRAAS